MLRNRSTTAVAILLTIITLQAGTPRTAGAETIARPNIILILADDQGWNATSTKMDPEIAGSGSTYYNTPNLSRLASEGIRFSRAYSPEPTCGPTRHSIQFGRSVSSLGLFAECPPSYLKANCADSLANVLKTTTPDYVTAHLGKWHMKRSPDEMGFDVHDGPTGNGTGNSTDAADPKRIFDLSRRSCRFIEQQTKAGKPFFLQISHYANHLAYQALQETIETYETDRADHATDYQNSPLWAAMNENLDTGVGMVLDVLDELEIADNTYVIYTADNGYESKIDRNSPVAQRTFHKAHPLLSHKYTISEGGLRVPFIVRGPRIPADVTSRTPVIGYDIFPTIMDIVGHKARLPKTVEGGSLLPLMKSGGKEPVSRTSPFFVFRYAKTNGPHDIAIVGGDFKMLKEIDSGTTHLWKISKDLGEQSNLAEQESDMARQMYDTMTGYFKTVGWNESQVAVLPWKKKEAGTRKEKRFRN